MNLGSPIAIMLLFSLIALCAVFFALPAFKSPIPGFESKRCSECKKLSKYDAENCEHCGKVLVDGEVPEDEDLEDEQNEQK